MLTNWSQVESWVRDNNLSHWIFTLAPRTARSEGGGMPNDKVVDSDYYPDSIEEKLAITKRRLEDCGMRVYGYGWTGKRITDGVCCEVALLGSGGTFGLSGIGMVQPQAPEIDREELKTSLRKEIMAEIREADYDKRLKDLERREREFESEKNGMIGAAIHYAKPLLGAFLQKKGMGASPLANCAGIDNEEDVEAARIVPKQVIEGTEQAPEELVLPDEEADKLTELMLRFRKVEPQYIELIEAVVVMAENQDPTYTMAKGILLKS